MSIVYLFFRFCTAVRREGYPEDDPLTEFIPTKKLKVSPQPAHSITILAPLVLVNLLPCDLNYKIKNVEMSGNIKAGRSVPLYSVSQL
jgi:vacuolar protein sorting-associated protein 13D